MTRAKVHLHRQFLRRMTELSLSPSEFSILALTAANPGVLLRQLGRALDISPSNLVPVVDRLVQRGLIQRQPDPNDRRQQLLHITAAGKALEKQARQREARLEEEIAQTLTTQEHACLFSALDKLAAFKPGKPA